jgi:pyruvate-ferredoxin/flavodoxin oxidoreductase
MRPTEEIWDKLPRKSSSKIILEEETQVLRTIDAYEVAKRPAWAARVNTIMQTCFFAISGILPRGRSHSSRSSRPSRRPTASAGDRSSCKRTLRRWTKRSLTCSKSRSPQGVTSTFTRRAGLSPLKRPAVPAKMCSARSSLGKAIRRPGVCHARGWHLPHRHGTKWEKRNIALDIPVWETSICIQCNKCALVCPHASIRVKVFEPRETRQRRHPASSQCDYKGPEYKGTPKYCGSDRLQRTVPVAVCASKSVRRRARPKRR